MVGDGTIHADHGETVGTVAIRRAGVGMAAAQLRTYVKLLQSQAPGIRQAIAALASAEERHRT